MTIKVLERFRFNPPVHPSLMVVAYRSHPDQDLSKPNSRHQARTSQKKSLLVPPAVFFTGDRNEENQTVEQSQF
jgi:hypothetical protein